MKTDIKQIIEEYLKIFPNEKEKLNKLKSLIDNNENNYNNLFNRKNFEGHITASGYIYSKAEKKILLLEHKALKKFLQPGGHAELLDNEIIDTAKREIKEETGLQDLELVNIAINKNIPLDINTHFIPKNEKKKEDGHYHHDFRYLFIVDKIDDVKIDFCESNGYKWINMNDIRNSENFKGVVEKILKLLNQKYTIFSNIAMRTITFI